MIAEYGYGNFPPPPSYARRYDPKQNELQSPLLAGAVGAGVTGLTMATGSVINEVGIDFALGKLHDEGTLTDTFDKTMRNTGILKNARNLFDTQETTGFFGKTGAVLDNSRNLIEKTGGHLDDFGKTLLETRAGKRMAFWTAAGTVVGAGVAAHKAGQHNQKIVDRQSSRMDKLELLEQARTDQVLRSMNSNNSVDVSSMLPSQDF